MMVSLYGWRTLEKWWKYEVGSHCNGWPTLMEKIWWSAVSLSWVTYPDGKMWYDKCEKNRTYLAKFWRDNRRKGWKTWCFLIILDHRVWKLSVSWLQRLKTRGFPIARLIFSFLWDFLMVRFIPSSFYSVIKTDSLLLSPPCFLLFPPSRWTSLKVFL